MIPLWALLPRGPAAAPQAGSFLGDSRLSPPTSCCRGEDLARVLSLLLVCWSCYQNAIVPRPHVNVRPLSSRKGKGRRGEKWEKSVGVAPRVFTRGVDVYALASRRTHVTRHTVSRFHICCPRNTAPSKPLLMFVRVLHAVDASAALAPARRSRCARRRASSAGIASFLLQKAVQLR